MAKNDDIKAGLSEARVYESMGLFTEALSVYEKILPNIEQGDSEIITEVSDRISNLKKKLSDDASKKNEASEISEEALAHIIESRKADEKDITPILDRASVFTERGLHAEAANEYAMLFSLGFSPATVISPIIDTLVAICPHGQMGEEITRVIDKLNLPTAELIEISREFGMEAAERAKFISAIDIVEKLKALGADKKDVEDVFRKIVDNFIAEPRSAFLIRHTPLTDKQLEEALVAAHKEKRSVLSALVSHHLIEKAVLLEALSTYHECSAVTFDDTIQPPPRLVTELDKSILLSRRWVPLDWDDTKADVLMENPQDIYQQDQVKSYLSTSAVQFKLGIQEDIELFIEHFFKRGAELRENKNQKESSDADDNMVMDIVEMLEQKNGHRRERDISIRPQLISAELMLTDNNGKEEGLLVRLKDSSEYGFGILVSSEEYTRLEKIKSGDTIDDIIFYAGWAMVRTRTTVKNVTRIKTGKDKGQYFVEVESDDIV